MSSMDTPIDTSTQRRRKLRSLAPAVVFVVIAVVVLTQLTSWMQPTVKRDRIRTAFVEKGEVSATLDASGLVVPQFEQILTAPLATRVIKVLRTNGAEVKKGEPIVLLDDADARRVVARLEEQIDLKNNARRRANLELDRNRNDLTARKAIKVLELESFTFELGRNRELFQEGLVSEDKVRVSETAVARTKIDLQLLETQLLNSQEDLATRLQGLELEVSILDKDLVGARRQLARMQVTSDRAGIVTWVVTSAGAAVAAGEPVARVANLSEYRVDASLSDVLARRLTVGLPAMVRSGDTRLPGHVTKILPTVQNGIVTFEVELEENDHAVLRPNLRVDVHAVTEQRTDTLSVKRGPILNVKGTDCLFVIREGKAVRTPVVIGLSNFEKYEITAGLVAGDEVVISDMSDYFKAKEVKLR
jgi:HlyD family secretion protein